MRVSSSRAFVDETGPLTIMEGAIAGDAIELLSNAAMDEPRRNLAALLEDSPRAFAARGVGHRLTNLRRLNGWEEQPDLAGATTFRSRPWMSRHASRGLHEDYVPPLVRGRRRRDRAVLEALVREGLHVGAPLARVRRPRASSSWRPSRTSTCSTPRGPGSSRCARAQASPVLMAEEDVRR